MYAFWAQANETFRQCPLIEPHLVEALERFRNSFSTSVRNTNFLLHYVERSILRRLLEEQLLSLRRYERRHERRGIESHHINFFEESPQRRKTSEFQGIISVDVLNLEILRHHRTE